MTARGCTGNARTSQAGRLPNGLPRRNVRAPREAALNDNRESRRRGRRPGGGYPSLDPCTGRRAARTSGARNAIAKRSQPCQQRPAEAGRSRNAIAKRSQPCQQRPAAAGRSRNAIAKRSQPARLSPPRPDAHSEPAGRRGTLASSRLGRPHPGSGLAIEQQHDTAAASSAGGGCSNARPDPGLRPPTPAAPGPRRSRQGPGVRRFQERMFECKT